WIVWGGGRRADRIWVGGGKSRETPWRGRAILPSSLPSAVSNSSARISFSLAAATALPPPPPKPPPNRSMRVEGSSTPMRPSGLTIVATRDLLGCWIGPRSLLLDASHWWTDQWLSCVKSCLPSGLNQTDRKGEVEPTSGNLGLPLDASANCKTVDNPPYISVLPSGEGTRKSSTL